MYGQRIKELREEKGLTQEELGKLLQCTQRTVSRYELEQVELGVKTLISLCHLFKVSADYLLGLEDAAGAKTYR